MGPRLPLYEEALRGQPELAENMDARHRYNAACAARSRGVPGVGSTLHSAEEDRTRWRKQALDWLRADLEVWKLRASNSIP